MQALTPPVLVAGAGPVGLATACELARGGVPVRIVDRLAEPSRLSRAVGVHARTLEQLDSLGVASEMLAAGIRVPGVVLLAKGRTLAEAGFESIDSAFPFMLCLPQNTTEAILAKELTRLGVEVERPVELTGLEQDEAGATVELGRAGGGSERATFSYVVGADGAHSTVRRLVGTELKGTFHGVRFLLADCDAEHDLQRDRIYLVFHESGVLGIFPLHGRRCRLIAQLPDGTGEDEPTLEDAQRLCDERTGGRLVLERARWLTAFEIHYGQVPQYRFGRVFLAGDAAHIHSPAGGQGMNTGIQDAGNLAWKLRLAWAGAAAPGLLDSYQAERHPVGESVVRLSTLMTRAGTARGATAQHVRDMLAAFALEHTKAGARLVERLSETTVSYRTSPIVAGLTRSTSRGALQPGDFAPDAGGLTDLLDGTVHTAVHLARGDHHASRENAVTLRQSFGSLLRHVLVSPEPGGNDEFDDVLPDPDGLVAERYGVRDELLALVRPDRYLAFLGEPHELAAAERVLAKTIG